MIRNEQELGHLEGKPADLSTFRRAWSNELPWIRIAKSDSCLIFWSWIAWDVIGCHEPMCAAKESMFTACSACTFLKNLLDKTPRSETQIVAAVRKRLGQTLYDMVLNIRFRVKLSANPDYRMLTASFQEGTMHSRQPRGWALHAVKRCADGLVTTGAKLSTQSQTQHKFSTFTILSKMGLIWWCLRYLSIDKCDQNKTILPCVHHLLLNWKYCKFTLWVFVFIRFIRFRARSSQGWPLNCSRGKAALLWGWWAFILLAPNAAWINDGCSSMWKRGRLLCIGRVLHLRRGWILFDDDTGKYIPRRRFAGNHVDKADSQDSCQRRPTSKLFVRWRGQHSKRDEELNCDLLGNFHVGKSSRHCAVGHWVPVPACRAHPRISRPVLFTFDHCLTRKNVLHNGRDGRHINFMSQGLQGQLVPPRIHLQFCSSQNAFWHWVSQIPECARIATLRGLSRFVGEVEAVCFGWNLVPAAFGGWVWSPWCICICKASLGGSWVRWDGERQVPQLLEQAWALAWLFIVDSKEVVTENPRYIRCHLLMLRNRRWLHLASPRKSNWPSCDHMWMDWMPAHLWQLGPQLNLNDWPHTEFDWDEFHG